MPHVILKGTVDFQKVHSGFKRFRADSNEWIIKIQDCLISSSANLLLFECTAVRSGFSQDFYIRAESKGTISVRVDPYMRIERNEGVQRTILAIAKLLMASEFGLGVDKTNLPPEIAAELS